MFLQFACLQLPHVNRSESLCSIQEQALNSCKQKTCSLIHDRQVTALLCSISQENVFKNAFNKMLYLMILLSVDLRILKA